MEERNKKRMKERNQDHQEEEKGFHFVHQ